MAKTTANEGKKRVYGNKFNTPQLENAFKRIQIPVKAIVIVLEPGEVHNPELLTYLRTQGYEITPVQDIKDVTELVPGEMAQTVFNMVTTYPPEVQNQIFKAVYSKLVDLRFKEMEQAEIDFKNADQHASRTSKNKSELLNFLEPSSNAAVGLFKH